MQAKNNKKVIRSWAFFDWANSGYNLVITSTVFPAYYSAITSDKDKSTIDYVYFLGYKFVNSALYSYVLASILLLVAILSPILSSIADYKGNKKQFMKFFTFIGSMACMSMFFFTENTVQLGIVLCAIAALGYWGSLVFYNAYLPEIASPDQQDAVSAKGFAYGYVGSVILQILCFIVIFFPHYFGIDTSTAQGATLAIRISFVMVGIWWLSFALIPFIKLPDGRPMENVKQVNVFTQGFRELNSVWQRVKTQPAIKRFLTSFFLYSMGVQTVMLMATIFGEKELQLSTEKLIGTILLLQLVAIPGAMLMSYLAKRVYGNLRVLMGVVAIWMMCCMTAFYIQTELQFYILAGIIGLIMGGIQALSRSTYSKLIPSDTVDPTSYFSFYDVSEKLALVLGMFSFGLIDELSGSMRNSALMLSVFFVFGFISLYLTLKVEPESLKAETGEVQLG